MIGLAGFDRAVVRQLPAEHAAWMYGLAAAGLLGVVIVAAAGAYEMRLLFERPAGLAFGMLCTLLIALNVLRLLNAGLGATAALPFAVWRPKIVAVVLSWVVATLLAQPIVTWVLRDTVDAVIAVKRDAVVTLHREQLLGGLEAEIRRLEALVVEADAKVAAMVTAGVGDAAAVRRERASLEARRVALESQRQRAEAAELPAFAAEIGRAGFVADRIRAAWQMPGVAFGLTVLIATLISLGGLLRWPAREAVREYEALRHRTERELIERAYAVNQERCRRLLARYGTFQEIREWHDDPPYNTLPKPVFPTATPIEWEALMERLRQQV